MVNRHVKTSAAVVLAGALFAAGGMGTATAAKLISGSRIAEGTITAKQLGDNSVGRAELQNGIVKDGKDGKDGETGPAGPAGDSGTAGAEGVRGAQGPAGPQGVPGAPGSTGADGADGVSGFVTKYHEVRVAAGATGVVTLTCGPLGGTEVALGGGYYSDQSGLFTVVNNGPLFSQTADGSGETGTAHGWTVTAVNNSAGARNITGVVNCATVN